MKKILRLLAQANALHQGLHFVYTSEDHGEEYVNLRVLRWPEYRQQLVEVSLSLIEAIVPQALLDLSRRIVVIGPDTLGAIIAEIGVTEYRRRHDIDISYLRLVAHTPEDGSEKTFSFEKEDLQVALNDAQIVYVDDLMNESSTLRRCRQVIEAHAPIAAVGVIVDRSGKTAADLEIPHFISLEQVQMQRFKPENCPLCAINKPIVTNLGHGGKFRDKHPKYSGGFIEI